MKGASCNQFAERPAARKIGDPLPSGPRDVHGCILRISCVLYSTQYDVLARDSAQIYGLNDDKLPSSGNKKVSPAGLPAKLDSLF